MKDVKRSSNKTRSSIPGVFIVGLGLLILLASTVFFFDDRQVQPGDTVRIHYSLSLEDGGIYYSSIQGEPMQYTLGTGSLLPGFEAALIGMWEGEDKTIRLPYTEAYGPYQPQLVMLVDRNELPEGSEPVVGVQFQTTSQLGNPLIMTITEVTEKTVTLDANHPLAGQNLTFYVQLLGIEQR